MSSIDERTVKMRFDNAGFKKAASETQASLSAVDAAVAKSGKGRGLLDMAGHMETVKVKASAMQVAVVTALANVVTKAVDAGLRLGKALTLDPLVQGFNEYELKIKSIQTILANTKGENLESVTAALNELNTYADKTIYNFANMTMNIGKLTTAGINLTDATAVVKGFSNMVALAGGDATAAAGAMEQFGQGLQAGAIKAIDWMSISTRGLGSQSLQKAFFETARAAGSLKDVPLTTTFEEWSKSQGGFKASLEAGWLTTDVATETLKIMTGDIKDAQDLIEMGFDPKTAEDMLKIAENALDSATKVRTFTAFMGTLKEQIGSGFSQVLEILIGDFNKATNLFTKWSDTTGKVVGKIFGYLERLAKGFEKFGGRTAALETMKNVLAPIGAILGLIAAGWKKAFGGGDTGRGMATMWKALQHITRPLRILGKLISGQITPLEAWKRLIEVTTHALRNFGRWTGGKLNLDKLFGKVPNGDSVLTFVKDLIREVREAIEDVEKLVEGSGKLGNVFDGFKIPDFGGSNPLSKITGLAGGLDEMNDPQLDIPGLPEKKSGGLFNPDATLDTSRISDATDRVKTAVNELSEQGEEAQTTGDVFMSVFGGLLGGIKDFFSGFNFDDLVASFNLAVIATMFISISKFLNTLSNSFAGFVGTGEAINGILESAGNALGSFQTAARAKLILAIGISIGILAVSLWLLSKIPWKQMVTGLAGMAGIMLIMKVGVDSIVKAVEKMDGKGTPFKLGALSLALLALGAAVLMLTGAFILMRFVKWEDMLKGLLTIAVVMKMMEGLGKLGEHAAKNLAAGAFAIGLIAGSMIVLAGALLLFKLIDWEDMGKAGVALAAVTLAVGALALIPYEGISKVGVAFLAVSVGMLALANALLIFGLVKWESIGKAAVILVALTAALAALMFVGGGPVGAAAFLGIGAGMLMLATAGLMLNKVDWSTIGKIAVLLILLTAGVAAFLAILSFFAPTLIILSAFAGSLALLSLAITGLMIALAAIGPIMAAGAGAFAAFATGAAVAFAVFMTTLAAEAPIIKDAFLNILQVIIDGIVEAVPMIMKGMQDLWDAIVNQVKENAGSNGKAAGLMGEGGKSWMDKLKDGIKKKIPEIVKAAIEIGKKFLDGLIKNAGQLSAKGAVLVANLISGIASKIDRIASAATDLIIQFAQSIGKGLDRIVKAGIALIAQFLHDLANAIRNGSAAIGSGLTDILDAMKDVGVNMIKGLISGLKSMVGDAMSAITDLAGDMIAAAKDKFKVFSPSRVFKSIGKFLVQGLTNGVQENAVSAINAVASMVGGQIAVANEYISKFIQKLDQQAIAAGAKAAGLADAAEEASRSADAAARRADKTKKNKKDDRKARKAQQSAEKLSDAAEKAAKRAEAAEAKAEKAKEAQDRADEFEKADLLTKAQMRSEDAQMSMDEAKEHEFNAARKLAEAEALDKQAGAKGVSAKDAKAMRKEADRLRKKAEEEARKANQAVKQARTYASDALALQTAAGQEAERQFQERYNQEAADDAAEDAFNKLTDAEKAVKRREQADALQRKADQQLADAKKLAYTDLETANELADEANANAQKARDYLDEAAQLEEKKAGGTGTSAAITSGRVVNTAITDAASLAMQRANERYDAATAAAAAAPTVEFNQYNSSPESLNPSEVYRRTHNLLEVAGDLIPAA